MNNRISQFQDLLTEHRIVVTFYDDKDDFSGVDPYDAAELFYLAAHIDEDTPLINGWYRVCSHERLKIILSTLNNRTALSFLNHSNMKKFVASKSDGVYINSRFFNCGNNTVTQYDSQSIHVVIPVPLICSVIYQSPPDCLRYFGMWLLSIRFLNPHFNILTEDVACDEEYDPDKNNYPKPLYAQDLGWLCGIGDYNEAVEFLKQPITVNIPYKTRQIRLYTPKKMNGWMQEGFAMPFELLLPADIIYGYMVNGKDLNDALKEWGLGV